MTIEILRFTVVPGRRDAFIQRNEALWTPALRERPGFIRRELLTRPEDPDEIVIIIYWRSRADLEAFPAEEQRQLDEQMADLVRGQQQTRYERALPVGSEESDPV